VRRPKAPDALQKGPSHWLRTAQALLQAPPSAENTRPSFKPSGGAGHFTVVIFGIAVTAFIHLIFFEQALLIAFNQAKLYPGMYDSTIAILFLGCPHQGSSAADYAKVLARIVNAAFISSQALRIKGVVRSDLLNSLQKNGVELLQIADDFRVHTDRIHITSFIEKKKMKGLNQLVRCVQCGALRFTDIGHPSGCR
jgi:hypothetical protein